MMQGIVHSIIVVFCLGGAAAFAQTQEQLIAGAKKDEVWTQFYRLLDN